MRLLSRNWLAHRRAPAPAPFVVGLGRSGTTLLRLMLDAHPQLAIPPETHFAPAVIRMYRNGAPGAAELADHLSGLRRWGDFGITREQILERLRAAEPLDARRALRTFYELYAEHQGKPRWGRQDAGLRDADATDLADPAGGPLRAPDPRRP